MSHSACCHKLTQRMVPKVGDHTQPRHHEQPRPHLTLTPNLLRFVKGQGGFSNSSHLIIQDLPLILRDTIKNIQKRIVPEGVSPKTIQKIYGYSKWTSMTSKFQNSFNNLKELNHQGLPLPPPPLKITVPSPQYRFGLKKATLIWRL